MNVRPAQKKDNSNGLIGGALGAAIGTAFGATFGVGSAYAYNRLTTDDDPTVDPTIDPEVDINVADDDVEVADPNNHTVHVHTHVTVVDPQLEPEPEDDPCLADPDPEPYPEPAPEPEPEPEPDPDNSVEVVSFERVTLDDGSQADMALVNINGEEAAIVDIDLDGWADAMMADIDHSGDISDNEIVPINSDQPIAMAPLAEAVSYDYDDPINGGGSTMVVDDDGGCCPPDCGDDGCCPPTDDDNLLIVSNDGSDGIIPDYVNNGDVSDMAGDVTLV